jgi:valyl-tRNA synthetase
MGHALVNTLQDILIRWHRMKGEEALWVPGTDHAGISTQTVVERHLIKTKGKRRQDFSREEFLAHVWSWKEDNENQILAQLRRLGCSLDWSRQRFTMDAGNNRAVRVIFKRLYDAKLIYRGDYLVNWDPVTQTAIADDEVEYEDRQSFLWYFRYPLTNSNDFISIATTRPETMLGDTAVAVSPKDTRYTSLIGKTLSHPLTGQQIPIIADPFVDPEFGTGAVKITPAHDPNDYQIGLSHQLPFVNIMTPDGKINNNGGKFAGLTIEEARQSIIQEMKDKGALEKIVPHLNRVGISYRSKAVIEPYMSKQWFVNMQTFAPKLKAAVREGKTQLIPKNWENTYFHWIDNLRDWCISRQLWWGHRIPIWYNKKDPDRMLCFDGEGLPPEVVAAREEWRQEEDVLDTWFSSALWPFATLGWPDETPELKKFYPNSVLVTGYDILFFWVARMILMGEYATGKLPFPEVFLHGLIYGKSYWRENKGGGISYIPEKERMEYEQGKAVPKDVFSKWEKMSKSKGNIIDPLEIIDLYGTDAMRMALCASNPQAREIDLDLRRFEEFKNFANKIWNGARFIFLNLEGNEEGAPPLSSQEFCEGIDTQLLSLEDQWILSVLNRTIRDVNQHLASYLFDQAAQEAYDFFWKEFCSYYIEIAKPVLFGKAGTSSVRKNKQKLLAVVLCQALLLIHPMAPFISEELFQRLKAYFGKSLTSASACDPYTLETIKALNAQACAVAPFPKVIRESDLNPTIDKTFEVVGSVVYTIRNIRGEVKLPPAQATDVHIIGSEKDPLFQIVKSNQSIISALVRVNNIEVKTSEPYLPFSGTGVLDTLKIIIPLPEAMLKQEKSRLEKEHVKLAANFERLKTQLANSEFVKNAPQELIDKQNKALQQTENELREIATKMSLFERT